MFYLLVMILRVLELTCGVVLIYASLFLYEDEQGKVQNTVEDLWIKLNEKHRTLQSRHLAFMRVVGQMSTSTFDRLFGKRLFSLQSLGVSASFCWASISLSWLVYFREDSELIETKEILWSIGTFIICVGLGILPLLIQTRSWLIVWFGCVVALPLIIVPAFFLSGWENASHVEELLFTSTLFIILFTIGTVFVVLCEFLFIAVTRRLLRWSEVLDSFQKVATVIVLNLLMASLLTVVPLLGARVSYFDISGRGLLSFFCGFIGLSNSITALAAMLFVLLAASMLLHRVFWPLVERPIYATQRLGIIRRNKLLGAIGLALVAFGIGIESALLKIIVEGFTKP